MGNQECFYTRTSVKPVLKVLKNEFCILYGDSARTFRIVNNHRGENMKKDRGAAFDIHR
jgi:hypothetical protein